MSVGISVPKELYEQAAAIAAARQISVDEVFAAAFVEQVAAWRRLRERAARGSRERFLAVLDKAPDVEPADYHRHS